MLIQIQHKLHEHNTEYCYSVAICLSILEQIAVIDVWKCSNSVATKFNGASKHEKCELYISMDCPANYLPSKHTHRLVLVRIN